MTAKAQKWYVYFGFIQSNYCRFHRVPLKLNMWSEQVTSNQDGSVTFSTEYKRVSWQITSCYVSSPVGLTNSKITEKSKWPDPLPDSALSLSSSSSSSVRVACCTLTWSSTIHSEAAFYKKKKKNLKRVRQMLFTYPMFELCQSAKHLVKINYVFFFIFMYSFIFPILLDHISHRNIFI